MIIAVVVILLLLGAWFFIFNKKAPEAGQQTALPGGGQNQEEQASPGIKESLLGLLEGAAGVSCAVEDANGKYTVTAKGERAKIEGMDFPDPQNPSVMEKGTIINDGDWAYMWSGKEGIKFNLKEMEQGSAPTQNSQENASDWKEWAKGMEESGAKYDCQPTVATDADFTPPSDVKFQDLGEMFKGLQQMQGNPNLPIDPSQFQMPGN